MHPQMVVGKDIGRSVDIMEGQPHCGHHTLAWRASSSSRSWSSSSPTYARLGVTRGCGEESSNVDVVLVMAMSAKTRKYWQTTRGFDNSNGLFLPVGVNLVAEVGSVCPPVVLGLGVPPDLRGHRGHRGHQGHDDLEDGDEDHPESLLSLDSGHWKHSCLVAWRGATSKMFPNYSEFKVKDRLEAHLFDKS